MKRSDEQMKQLLTSETMVSYNSMVNSFQKQGIWKRVVDMSELALSHGVPRLDMFDVAS